METAVLILQAIRDSKEARRHKACNYVANPTMHHIENSLLLEEILSLDKSIEALEIALHKKEIK